MERVRNGEVSVNCYGLAFSLRPITTYQLILVEHTRIHRHTHLCFPGNVEILNREKWWCCKWLVNGTGRKENIFQMKEGGGYGLDGVFLCAFCAYVC